jgi:hypothetical protein
MDIKVFDLIQEFISGQDVSIDAANQIEVRLDDAFPENDAVQKTVEMLAMYRPEGGEFLFDTADLKRQLTSLIAVLKNG